MGIEWDELKLPALGRPVFLGQLYDASSGRFLNVRISDDELVQKIQTETHKFNSVKFKDVDAMTDRADALDVSAEIGVGFLADTIELKGAGRYVDASKSNVVSREVSMICSTRTTLERINVDSSTYVSRKLYERATARGATHVVTGIVYGGTLIANVKDRMTTSESHKRIEVEISASLFRRLAALFSVKGKIAVDYDTTSKEVVKTREFEVFGDYASSEQPIPVTIGDIFELIGRWPKLVGKGVPCEIIATPLAALVDESVEAKIVHELESDDLSSIMSVFDQVLKLAARRTRVQAVLEAGLGQHCPTFLNECRKRKTVIDGIVGRSRQALARYLLAFRDGGVEKAGEAEEFLERVREGYNAHLVQCEADESMLGLLQDIGELAAGNQAPLVTTADLRRLMTYAAHGALGVVLTPAHPNISDMINTFDVLVANIRAWRADEDKKTVREDGKPAQTVLVSYYCDGSLMEELMLLDAKKVIPKALSGFGKSDSPRFMHYGMLPTGPRRGQFGWSLLNDEGWALINNEQESSYYTGQVSNGKRHGRGSITFADGSTYVGDWWRDARHGQGELVEEYKRSVGVFIDDRYREDGVIVDMTVIAHHSPVAAYKVPLRKHDSTTAHVQGIGRMLGWTGQDEYKLYLEETSTAKTVMEVRVVGTLLKPGQEELANASWPLSKGVWIKAERWYSRD